MKIRQFLNEEKEKIEFECDNCGNKVKVNKDTWQKKGYYIGMCRKCKKPITKYGVKSKDW
jgi:hypothetical protein